jgi:pectate lyase
MYIVALGIYLLCLSIFSKVAHGQELDPIGYGGSTTGGRGGSITYVTNLNDSGAGSLRACLNTSNTNCVFRVGGEIQLASELTQIGFNNVSVWGMSAPKPVIVTSRNIPISGSEGGRTFQLFNSDNIRMHNLTFVGYQNSNYVGASHSQCCDVFSVQGTNPNIPQNILLQNLSVFGGNDETTSFTATSQATFINSIIGLPLSFYRGHFGAGNLTGAADADNTAYSISFLRNFFVGSYRRNPETKVRAQEIINNLIQNVGPSYACQTIRGGGNYTIMNNHYKCVGMDSPIEHMANAGVAGISKGPSGSPSIYMSGNMIWGKTPKQQFDLIRFRADSEAPYQETNDNLYRAAAPLNATTASNILTASELTSYNNFGNSWRRDGVGQKVNSDDGITTAARSYINNPELNLNRTRDFLLPSLNTSSSATAYLDADTDGMADEWEDAVGLNRALADHNGTTLSGGSKTNLECFMLDNCLLTLNSLYVNSHNRNGTFIEDATEFFLPSDIGTPIPEAKGVAQLKSLEGFNVIVDKNKTFIATRNKPTGFKNVLSCPHRFHDLYTGDICLELFKESEKIDAVIISTTHRYHCANVNNCDNADQNTPLGCTPVCDLARNPNSLFHHFVRYYLKNNYKMTQIHGFSQTYTGIGDKAGQTLDIIIASSFSESLIPSAVSARLADLESSFSVEYPGKVSGSCYATAENLCATVNTVNEDPSIDSTAKSNFTHIEFKRNVRDEICSRTLNAGCAVVDSVGKTNRAKLLKAIQIE